MSRLPCTPRRLEGRYLNQKRDPMPRLPRHPSPEIDEVLDEIALEAITVIQEDPEANALRTFYFNLMSDADYNNKDFIDLIMMIGDTIDMNLREGRLRRIEDGIYGVTKDIVMLHIGFQCHEYPELFDYMPHQAQRTIEAAIKKFGDLEYTLVRYQDMMHNRDRRPRPDSYRAERREYRYNREYESRDNYRSRDDRDDRRHFNDRFDNRYDNRRDDRRNDYRDDRNSGRDRPIINDIRVDENGYIETGGKYSQDEAHRAIERDRNGKYVNNDRVSVTIRADLNSIQFRKIEEKKERERREAAKREDDWRPRSDPKNWIQLKGNRSRDRDRFDDRFNDRRDDRHYSSRDTYRSRDDRDRYDDRRDGGYRSRDRYDDRRDRRGGYDGRNPNGIYGRDRRGYVDPYRDQNLFGSGIQNTRFEILEQEEAFENERRYNRNERNISREQRKQNAERANNDRYDDRDYDKPKPRNTRYDDWEKTPDSKTTLEKAKERKDEIDKFVFESKAIDKGNDRFVDKWGNPIIITPDENEGMTDEEIDARNYKEMIIRERNRMKRPDEEQEYVPHRKMADDEARRYVEMRRKYLNDQEKEKENGKRDFRAAIQTEVVMSSTGPSYKKEGDVVTHFRQPNGLLKQPFDPKELQERKRLADEQTAKTNEAFDREEYLAKLEKEGKYMNTYGDVIDPNVPILEGGKHFNMWYPSIQYPHPFAWDRKHVLIMNFEKETEALRPILHPKDVEDMDYNKHSFLTLKDVKSYQTRFSDAEFEAAQEELLNALKEDTSAVDNENESLVLRKLDLTDKNIIATSLNEAFERLDMSIISREAKQSTEDKHNRVNVALGKATVFKQIVATQEEIDILNEIRNITSFSAVRAYILDNKDKLRDQVLLKLDNILTDAINRIISQNLSIPKLSTTTFLEDYDDLIVLIEKKYGPGYRAAIETQQKQELVNLFKLDSSAEIYALTHISEDIVGVSPFVSSTVSKAMKINENLETLDIDMIPGIASQLIVHRHKLFDAITQNLLNDEKNYARFYIQTKDLHLLEVSRSYLNKEAILLRVID